VSQSLLDIIDENDWKDTPFYLFSETLSPFCEAQHISFTHNAKESNVLFTSCEYLIAQNGSILISENQIGEMKLDQLPNNIIVYATTSQLLDSITDGLKQIKRIYKERIPGNITTLKNFKTEEETKEDFLSYGSSVKNLYLILLEDL
jgi:L-lactate utilization protein LutB